MSITSKAFGKTPAGEPVQLFTLKNSGGMEVHIMNYGGIITKILTPNKNGKIEDVVLGFETLDEYIKDTPFLAQPSDATEIESPKVNLPWTALDIIYPLTITEMPFTAV